MGDFPSGCNGRCKGDCPSRCKRRAKSEGNCRARSASGGRSVAVMGAVEVARGGRWRGVADVGRCTGGLSPPGGWEGWR